MRKSKKIELLKRMRDEIIDKMEDESMFICLVYTDMGFTQKSMEENLPELVREIKAVGLANDPTYCWATAIVYFDGDGKELHRTGNYKQDTKGYNTCKVELLDSVIAELEKK